jgi:hypothetical protein
MPAKVQQIHASHFLSNNNVILSGRGTEFFPLFIKIEAFGKQVEIKSQINEYLSPYTGDVELSLGKDKEMTNLVNQGYFSSSLFDQIHQLAVFPLFNLLKDELKLIKLVVRHFKKEAGKNFSFENFASVYQIYSADISTILDKNIKKKYYAELRNVFERQLNDKKNPRAYKVSSFFLHFIRWDNDFFSIYENCYEMMPGELKFLENYYSPEMINAIKAYLAYQPRASIFKNMFGKQEKGEITRLTYLDWLNVKKLLSGEFDKIFGDRTAREYIEILEDILKKELETV